MKGSIIAFDPCPHCENHDMCSKCELTFRRNGVIANPCEWISVEERLPERCGCYLGCTYKGYIMLAPFYPYTLNDKPQFRYDITHWMPLPEAPKGGEEE